MGPTDELTARTRDWISQDPDPVTRSELEGLIAAGDYDGLADQMDGSLVFGTAGLRAVVEGGSNRMNRAVVIRTTKGLADYLLARDDENRLVVVGYDARPSSRVLMEDTVGVLAAAGLEVRYFDEVIPTPLVAYMARAHGAAAAVVITASHNPPRDNGYKVYDANAAQIIPPVDSDIAAAIAQVGRADQIPRSSLADGDTAPISLSIFDGYLSDLEDVRAAPPAGQDLSIVHTPIHGVGGKFVMDALRRCGYEQVRPVAEQIEPDGTFPTVAFPNPEEPQALELALTLATDLDADIVLANDPDTDRLSVSLPTPAGKWRTLSGNQVGSLLGDFVLEHTSQDAPIVITSIVSSPMLSDIARGRGARHVSTLTGFKWIGNAALELEAAGEGTFVFGYEEALGYSVGRAVRDKDGISAAVTFADLTAWARSNGLTVWDRLAALYQTHGLWVSTQQSVVRMGARGAEEIVEAIDRVASDPPATLGQGKVEGVTDYRTGATDRPSFMPAASLVEFDLGDRGRALARPSGTEPKLKVYVDLKSHLAAGEDVWESEGSLLVDAEQAAADLVVALGLPAGRRHASGAGRAR